LEALNIYMVLAANATVPRRSSGGIGVLLEQHAEQMIAGEQPVSTAACMLQQSWNILKFMFCSQTVLLDRVQLHIWHVSSIMLTFKAHTGHHAMLTIALQLQLLLSQQIGRVSCSWQS
jgi:hypothetical protein